MSANRSAEGRASQPGGGGSPVSPPHPTPPSAFREKLLDGLHRGQRAAVLSDARRILIIAGAGTGKTRTLTRRVARLIGDGLSPERIILATFTHRAAEEMVARIERLLGPKVRRLRAGTFHALAYAALTKGLRARKLSPLRVLGPEDQRDLIATALAQTQTPSSPHASLPSAQLLKKVRSMAINCQTPLSEALLAVCPDYLGQEQACERVFSAYEALKAKMGALDLDDLLVRYKNLLLQADSPEAAAVRNVAHVLVDEFQDTNRLQADIAQLWSQQCRNLCVVGDDAQSIFAFRGARFDNILEFPRIASTQIHTLTLNYRSNPEILSLANAVIHQNLKQFKKDLEPTRPAGGVVVVVPARDPQQEADFVAQRCLELFDEGVSLHDQAVLFRAHRNSVELQKVLAQAHIPFSTRTGSRMFEEKHIKDLFAFLRLCSNPKDELALRRVLHLLPGIGSQTQSRIVSAMGAQAAVSTTNISRFDSSPPPTGQSVDTKEETFGPLARPALLRTLPARARSALVRLKAELVEGCSVQNPASLIAHFLGSSRRPYKDQPTLLLEYALKDTNNTSNRLQELRLLQEIAQAYPSVDAFLADGIFSGKFAGMDKSHANNGAQATDNGQLTLSTIHQAKGLEWPVVFVIGLQDGSLPIYSAHGQPDQEDEERRLLYVAVTRARDQVYLSYPCSRRSGHGRQIVERPSPFLCELRPELYEKWNLEESDSKNTEEQTP